MPRLKNRLPRMRRDREYAVVTIGGERIYLGRWGTEISRVEYDRVVAEWLVAGRRSMQPAGGPTVSAVMLAYIREQKQNYADTDSQMYSIKAAIKLLKPWYGHTLADEFGPRALKAFRQRLIDEKDLSRNYVNETCKRIKGMFKWAASEEMISASIPEALNQVAGLKKGRTAARETKPVQPVKDEVLEQTVAELTTKLAAMVRLHRLLGCRPTELCEMKLCEIDRSGEVWIYTPEQHKTRYAGKVRAIAIGPQAQAVIHPFLNRADDQYLFESSPGRCYSEDSYRNAVKRACERVFPVPTQWRRKECEKAKSWKARLAKLGVLAAMEEWRTEHHWSPNRLRHSRATEVRRVFGLEAAQVTLGHSSADVTQVYAERDHRLATEVAKKTG